MTEKLARRGLKVPEEYEAGVLKIVRVGEVMRQDVQPIPAQMTVGELAGCISGRKPAGAENDDGRSYNLTEGLPITGDDGNLCGMVTQGDLLRALKKDPEGKTTVLQAGSNKPIVAYPDELAFEALQRMLQNNIGRLPVVSRQDPKKLVGYFNRSSLLAAWSRQLEEEGVREHGWIRLWRNGSSVTIARK